MATTKFKVLGLTAAGAVHSAVLEASSLKDAERMARGRGVVVVDIRAVDSLFTLGTALRARGAERFDLQLFVHELLALLDAGLSLIETLEALIERQAEDTGAAAVLGDLQRQMREGLSFSRALRAHPGIFSALFVASVAASEYTGELAPALKRYVRYHTQIGAVRQKLVSASLYPAMLCVVGTAVTLFLLCILVPRFSRAYEGMQAQLPWASRWLMRWGSFLSEHGQAFALAGCTVAVLALVAFSRPAVRGWFVSGLRSVGWIGRHLRLMQLARFYRSLGLLLDGGIPVLKALQTAQGLLPVALHEALGHAAREVSEGRRLSDSLQEAALTTSVSLRLLRAGERNGRMAEMLEQAAAFHDAEVAHWLDRFTRLLEPVLMLVIGLVIGGIVVLLYLPIFELAGSLR